MRTGRAGGYSRLDTETAQNETEMMSTPATPAATQTPASTLVEECGGQTPVAEFKFVVLDKRGRTWEITDACPTTRVGDLKKRLATITEIDADLQRLIFRGRVLGDGQTLADCSVENGQTIHLFDRPRLAVQPVAVPTADLSAAAPTVAVGGGGDGGRSAILLQRAAAAAPGPFAFTHSDPEIMQYSRRIKLWSSVLLLLCSMQLLALFACFAQAWRPTDGGGGGGGGGGEDDAVDDFNYGSDCGTCAIDSDELFDLALNMIGVWSGIQGIKGAHTLELRTLRNYDRGLTAVAVMTVGHLVFGIIQIGNGQIDCCAYPDYCPANTGSSGDTSIDDSGGGGGLPTSQLVYSGVFTVAIWGMMWGWCVYRARQFTRAVEAYQTAPAAAPVAARNLV